MRLSQLLAWAFVYATVVVSGRGVAQPAVKRVAFWPLDDGTGQVARDRIGSFNGIFRVMEAGRELTWRTRDGQAVLVFPGSGNDLGGYIEIVRGGTILSGPVFALGMELHMDKTYNGGFLMTCKHGQKKVRGFSFHYFAGGRRLSFSFGDGKAKHAFTAKLKRKIPAQKWVPVSVTYDGHTLCMRVDGKVVGAFQQGGLALATSRDPLMIGAYFGKIGGRSFQGQMRNVWLGIPRAPNKPMLYNVEPVKTAPVIDGRLTDACWERADFVGDFVRFYEGKLVKPQTEFAVACDAAKLYVAARCFQPHMSKIRSPQRKRDAGELFGDDSIELFIDPDVSGNHYFQLALSAANVQFDSVRSTDDRHDFDMKWTSAVHKGAREWTAEIAIPFAELLAKPDNPGHWHFNVCRNNSVGEEWHRYSTWGRLKKGQRSPGYHDFNLFGTLMGLPKPQYAAKAAARVKRLRRKWGLDRKPILEKIALYPVHEPLVVANNLVAPNLLANKAPGKVVTELKAYYILDVPEGVRLLHVGRTPFKVSGGGPAQYETHKGKQVTHDGKSYARHIIRPVRIHRTMRLLSPIYMTSSLADHTRTDLYCGAKWKGGEQPMRKVSLVVRTFPTPGRPKKLVSSIAWMFDANNLAWPDMLDNYAKLGFNTISGHYGYDGGIPIDKRRPFWKRARQHGMKLLCVGSTFSIIYYRAEGNSTQPDGTPVADRDACPAYRGPLFQGELRKVEEAVTRMRPDIVNLDIEYFTAGSFRGKTGGCKRCGDYIKKSGKEPEDAITDVGADILVQVKKTLVRTAKREGFAVPALGIYHTKPGGFTYQDTFNFDKMFRMRAVEYCQPVCYGAAKARDWGKELRAHRKLVNSAANLMPWMTTGFAVTHVEYPPEWVYDYVLEAYGSGVGGIFWFAFAYMEGCDYYYHAKAMEAVVPVAEMLHDGRPIDGITCNKPGYSVTGLRRGEDVVLLVSNYDSPAPAKLIVTLPEAVKGQVRDLARKTSSRSVRGHQVRIAFEPGVRGGHTALYHVGQQAF